MGEIPKPTQEQKKFDKEEGNRIFHLLNIYFRTDEHGKTVHTSINVSRELNCRQLARIIDAKPEHVLEIVKNILGIEVSETGELIPKAKIMKALEKKKKESSPEIPADAQLIYNYLISQNDWVAIREIAEKVGEEPKFVIGRLKILLKHGKVEYRRHGRLQSSYDDAYRAKHNTTIKP